LGAWLLGPLDKKPSIALRERALHFSEISYSKFTKFNFVRFGGLNDGNPEKICLANLITGRVF